MNEAANITILDESISAYHFIGRMLRYFWFKNDISKWPNFQILMKYSYRGLSSVSSLCLTLNDSNTGCRSLWLQSGTVKHFLASLSETHTHTSYCPQVRRSPTRIILSVGVYRKCSNWLFYRKQSSFLFCKYRFGINCILLLRKECKIFHFIFIFLNSCFLKLSFRFVFASGFPF